MRKFLFKYKVQIDVPASSVLGRTPPHEMREEDPKVTKVNAGSERMHFAVMPEDICVRPILSSCPKDGVVLDPMCGSGTVLVVAKKLGRNYIGIDVNPSYVDIARRRLSEVSVQLDRYV